MTASLHHVTEFLKAFAPLDLAEGWDNVGLLLGDESAPVTNVMTCLTLTDRVADEAIRQKVQLIISHHPLLFRPIQKITSAGAEGRLLLKLLRNSIAVYSPHTSFDSAETGINHQLARRLQLGNIQVLRPSSSAAAPDLGAGRYGQLPHPVSLADFLKQVRKSLSSASSSDVSRVPMLLQYTGDLTRTVSKVAVACGSAGEFLKDSQRAGCDLFLTGETRFHTHLEAEEMGMALVLAGHYQTERPAVESLAELIQSRFSELKVWASMNETDPVQWSVE